MSTVEQTAFDASLLAAIRTALGKARDLGYPVERMDLTASPENGRWSIHFSPISAPGYVSAGGDLSLTVDPDTEEVALYKRGQ